MLVLSRKVNEKIVFPDSQTAVQIVALRGGVVRLGIEAPASVKIVRGELQALTREGAGQTAPGLPRELAHLLRNRLNGATLALALLRRQQQLGMTVESGVTLNKLDQEIQALRGALETGDQRPSAPPPATRPRKRKALLVEDDANERELLAGFLRLAGLDVDTAGDGDEALDRLRAHGRPDVVLLDMVLPRCDGPATLREIRRDPACVGLKVFAVTGHTRERFAAEAGTAGVNGWFRKPVNPEELLRELDRELTEVA